MRATPLFAVLILALAVAACGKRGPLLPPEDSQYPRTYPAPETMVPQPEDGVPQPEQGEPQPEEQEPDS